MAIDAQDYRALKEADDLVIGRLKTMIFGINKLVQSQAEDEGLWFQAQTAPEAYLQEQLRNLHTAVELAAAFAAKETP